MMTAYQIWKNLQYNWTRGRGTDESMLAATAKYLHESADWVEVRDWLIRMGFTKRQALKWFSENDFPDFSDAVKQGWGWPKELEDA